MKRIWLVFACSLLTAGGTLWGMTADDLVQKTGIAGGLCSFPRIGKEDVKLAIELAKRPTLVVHLLSQSPHDRDSRSATRRRPKGVLGRSLYVEQGPGQSAAVCRSPGRPAGREQPAAMRT